MYGSAASGFSSTSTNTVVINLNPTEIPGLMVPPAALGLMR